MNTILFLSLLTAPFCKNDTIVSIERPDSVVITQESGTTRIHVYGRKDDPEYQYDLKQTETPSTLTSIDEHAGGWDFNTPFTKANRHTGHTTFKPNSSDVNVIDFIHIGACIATNQKGDVPGNAGWNMGFDIVNLQRNLASGKDALFVGLGLEFNLLRASDDVQWTKTGKGVGTSPWAENVTDGKSRLTQISLSLPLRYSHAFSKNRCLDLSVEPQVALSNRIRNKYKYDSHKTKERQHGIGGQRFNLAFGIGFRSTKSVGIYLKYSPFNTWDSTSPLNYKMLTLGVSL